MSERNKQGEDAPWRCDVLGCPGLGVGSDAYECHMRQHDARCPRTIQAGLYTNEQEVVCTCPTREEEDRLLRGLVHGALDRHAAISERCEARVQEVAAAATSAPIAGAPAMSLVGEAMASAVEEEDGRLVWRVSRDRYKALQREFPPPAPGHGVTMLRVYTPLGPVDVLPEQTSAPASPATMLGEALAHVQRARQLLAAATSTDDNVAERADADLEAAENRIRGMTREAVAVPRGGR